MSHESHARAIKAAQSRLEQAREAAEALVPLHQEIASRFLVDWANYLIYRSLSEKREVAKELGKDKLSQLKAKFTSIVEELPTLVEEKVDKDVMWPHRQEIPDDIQTNTTVAYDLTRLKNDSFTEVLRHLIGHVGALLIEYGFEEFGRSSSWQSVGSGEYRYAYGLPSHPGVETGYEVGNVNKKYGKIMEEFATADKQLQEAEHARDASEVRDLWDSV